MPRKGPAPGVALGGVRALPQTRVQRRPPAPARRHRGKKYAKLKGSQTLEALLAKYDPVLAQSINFPDHLFCCLTNDLVEKTPSAILRHVEGKRFARAKGAALPGAPPSLSLVAPLPFAPRPDDYLLQLYHLSDLTSHPAQLIIA